MKHRCAILDDYQNVALKLADWSPLSSAVDIKVFNEPFADQKTAVKALQGFSIICMMRERTPFLKPTLEQLPDLKLLLTSGMRNASIDLEYAAQRGVTVCGTEAAGRRLFSEGLSTGVSQTTAFDLSTVTLTVLPFFPFIGPLRIESSRAGSP